MPAGKALRVNRAMYDYVIVGGGSAGCALAARLSEMPDAKVLLLEAGPRDLDPYIHMPVGFFKMTGGPLTWGYETAPLAHANNRVTVYPQARVLGGGGSINAEIYTRGVPEDYDAWANDYGCPGWSFKEMKPYFIKSENNSRLAGDMHGIEGPLCVSDLRSPSPLSIAFVQACLEIGMPYNPDFNSGKQEGAALYQTTIRNGRRCSAAAGYLKPARRRPNLTVKTRVFITRNIVEAGAFWWSDRNEKTPDLQFHFLAGAGVEKAAGTVPGGNGATCNSYFTRPRSRGSVTLRSNDPADPPLIDPNSFSEPYDLERSIDGIKISQEVGHSPSFRRFINREYFPGEKCKTSKDYEELARANARSSYHPVGTCKMGSDDMAVVMPDLRVRGIERLRVCDSSVMPRIVSSNTNAPTIAIAEKAADLIKGNR